MVDGRRDTCSQPIIVNGSGWRETIKLAVPVVLVIATLMGALFISRIEFTSYHEKRDSVQAMSIKELQESIKEHSDLPTHPPQNVVNARQEAANTAMIKALDAIQSNVEAIASEVEVPRWKIKKAK